MHRPLRLRVATAVGIGVAATTLAMPAEAATTYAVQTLHFAVTTAGHQLRLPAVR